MMNLKQKKAGSSAHGRDACFFSLPAFMAYAVIRWFEKHQSVMCSGEPNQEETDKTVVTSSKEKTVQKKFC